MEGYDVGYDDHPTSNRDNMAHQQANLDDNRRMTISQRNNKVNHPKELGQKVYFIMAEKTTTFTPWEKLQSIYEKK